MELLDYQFFSEEVRTKDRYFFSKRVYSFLNKLFELTKRRHHYLDDTEVFWRARKGCKQVVIEEERCAYEDHVPRSAEDMRPPNAKEKTPFDRKFIPSAGRVNPSGISYFYCADDKETAISEIKPYLGEKVSVAPVSLKRKCKVVDFSISENVAKIAQDESNMEEVLLSLVDNAFSVPINNSDDVVSYIPTQVIAEFFRSKGFEGIVYRSKLGSGKNIAFFDPDMADIGEPELVKIDKISVKFSPC